MKKKRYLFSMAVLSGIVILLDILAYSDIKASLKFHEMSSKAEMHFRRYFTYIYLPSVNRCVTPAWELGRLNPFTMNPSSVLFNTRANAIAVGGGLKFPKCKNVTEKFFSDQSLFKEFLPSFCKTISHGDFVYHFIFMYDFNDQCLSNETTREQMTLLFKNRLEKTCPPGVVKGFELLPCQYSGKPAWAQNDAMLAAYWRNFTFFYRFVA